MNLLTVDFLKELRSFKNKEQKVAIKDFKKEEKMLQLTNNILKDAESDDLEFLRKRGYSKPDNQFDVSSKKKIVDLTNQGCIHINSIKKMAIKYKLRFLPLAQYKGDMPLVIVQKMKEYEDSDHNHNPIYYILAPKESFKLEERPKDPILFAKYDDDYWKVIYKWGNDFSILRSIICFPFRSAALLHSFVFFVLLVITFCIDSFLVVHGFAADEPQWKPATLVIFNIIALIIMCFSFIEFDRNAISSQCWNDGFR